MKKSVSIFTTSLFLLFVFGFAVLGFLTPDQKKSVSENRTLAQFPKVNMSTLFSKGEDNAMEGFQSYVADQFPLRDDFRSIKAWLNYNLYGQKVNNGYFKYNGHVGKLEDNINTDSISHFTDAVTNVYNRYFADNSNVYYAVVPDKGYFLSQSGGYPTMDYNKFLNEVASKLPQGMEYIDIMPSLSLDKYYYTDIHWQSEKLLDTVKVIADKMSFADRLNSEHEVVKLTDAFGGVYYTQAAIPLKKEPMHYITNDIIEGLKVTVDGMPADGIYNAKYESDINGLYTYYLYGSKGVIEIENPAAASDKELILIRDSFGSAIAPWFVSAYSKVTVLDIRYVMPSMLEKFIGSSNTESDVLFLYSTSIINDSSAIKK